MIISKLWRDPSSLSLLAVAGYLSLVITTLHLEVALLVSIHLELLLLCAVIASVSWQILKQDRGAVLWDHPMIPPALLAGSLVFAPVLAALSQGLGLDILADGEFKSFVKILIFSPILFYVCQFETKERLLNAVSVFYGVLGCYFLYRFFVLHEARAYDSRPTLSIRHGDPNFLCAFFAMTVPLALLQMRFYFQKKFLGRVFFFGSLSGLLIFCALVTESRMGIIALTLGLGYLAFKVLASGRLSLRQGLGGLVVVFLMAGVVGSQDAVVKRFSDINDKSSVERIQTYENGWKLFLEAPIFGVGMGRSKDFYYQNTHYPDFQSEAKPLVVHNTYLGLLAELGVWGLLGFGLLISWSYFRIRRSAVEERPFLMASLAILILTSLTVGIAYKDLIIVQFFLLAGVALPGRRGTDVTI